MDRTERQEIERELSNGGFAIRELRNLDSQPKATYYTPKGKAIPNLPADPYSLKHYRLKGFSLIPPPPVSPRKRVVKKSRGRIRREHEFSIKDSRNLGTTV